MSKRRGFTLIELLVASIILLIVMIGLLRGILFYMQYSVQEQTKNFAVEVLKETVSRVNSLPYCDDNATTCTNPFLARPATYQSGWENSFCDVTGACSFEGQDVDQDGIIDFREPYNGGNNNFHTTQRNFAGWLNIRPANTGNGCVDRQGSSISGLQCVYQFKGNNVYVATTIARLVRYNFEVGKAVGVIVWYFDPRTRRYVGYSSVVLRERR